MPRPAPVPARTPDAGAAAASDAARLARLLDAAVRIPGTNVRIGLDAIIGIVPGIGDVAGVAMSGYIVLAGVRAGAPAPVLARMLLNIGLDTALGAVPVLGDLFDVAWKSNVRNLALIERHRAAPAATRAASRATIAGVLLALVALLALGVALGVLAVRALLSHVG